MAENGYEASDSGYEHLVDMLDGVREKLRTGGGRGEVGMFSVAHQNMFAALQENDEEYFDSMKIDWCPSKVRYLITEAESDAARYEGSHVGLMGECESRGGDNRIS